MSLELEPLAAQPITDEQGLRLFLDRLEQQLEQVSRTYSEMLFQQYQTKERPREMAEVEELQASLMTNPDYQGVVARFLGRVEDPLLARRLQAWDQQFRAARVSARSEIRRLVNEISDTIVQFRYQVQGDSLDLGGARAVLRLEQNRERRQAAWLSFEPLSRKLADRTRELFKLRNAAAREEGFATYAHMQLDAQGLTLDQVQSILEELAAASQSAYRQVIGRGADRHRLDAVQPWDVKFLLDGEGGLPTRSFPKSGILPRLEEWGRDHGRELQQQGISVHFLDIPYNGLSMTIHSRDIRILMNPADGHNYYKTAFHELGHAMHAAHGDPGSYILRREPSVWGEGMAETLGYTVDDPAWLAHVGLDAAEVAQAGALTMGPWFAYLRQRSAHALFEYAAYADPDADLDAINAEIEARFLGCTLDGTCRWAAEPNAWYSRYPVYWQNYVLADVIASQIHHDLRRRFGSVWRNPEAVAHIERHYWAPAGALDWQEKLRRGTGEGLSTRALVADLTR
jgi:oligoendopeptidase F